MTTLIIALTLLLSAMLVAAVLLCVRINSKRLQLERENILLQTQKEIADGLYRKCNEELAGQRQLCSEQQTLIASLKSDNNVLKERYDEQKEQLKTTLDHMRHEFRSMAVAAIEENARRLNSQSQEKLEAMLRPFGNDLKQFHEKIDNYYSSESKERFSLQENIKSLVDANRRISEDAVNLTRAISGTNNNKFQGDWGETVLEQILENSGLVEGSQWERQVTLRDAKGNAILSDESNRIMKPDVIIHFPGKRDIIIDSKVSLKAYMEYLSATDESMRALHLKEHVASVRSHVDNLAGKRYDKYNIHSLDYVMLFIPNEPSYFMAMEADNALWNYAYKKGIVLISPSNLISTLFVVNSLWTRERQQRDVQRIVDTANAIYDKFVNFADNFGKIETALEKAQEAYREAFKQLKTGKGNIAKRLGELKEMGLLTTTKKVPDNFVGEE